MANKVILKKGGSTEVNGWTSKIFNVARKSGAYGRKITLTNDYISIQSNYVNDKGNFFMLPNTQSETASGETRSYDNVIIDSSTREAVLMFGGEHRPLGTRTPDLENYEIILNDNISEGQKKAGIIAKITIKGTDWEVPNIAVFKDGSGEITFTAPRGVTIHPLVVMEMMQLCYEELSDVEVEQPADELLAEYAAKALEEKLAEETAEDDVTEMSDEELDAAIAEAGL